MIISNNFFIEDYKEFCETNFPFSSLQNEFEKQHFFETYKLIQKIIFHTDLCLDYLQDQGDKDFLKEIRNSYFELLYILPLHDYFITSSVFRAIAESVIRFVVFYDKKGIVHYNSVKGLSYTDLKKYYIDENNTKLKNIHSDIQVYFNLFKTKSQIIHDPLTHISSYPYLNNFIESSSAEYVKGMSQQLKLLWNFHKDTLGPFIDIKYNNISLPHKSKINRLFTLAEQKKIYGD